MRKWEIHDILFKSGRPVFARVENKTSATSHNMQFDDKIFQTHLPLRGSSATNAVFQPWPWGGNQLFHRFEVCAPIIWGIRESGILSQISGRILCRRIMSDIQRKTKTKTKTAPPIVWGMREHFRINLRPLQKITLMCWVQTQPN